MKSSFYIFLDNLNRADFGVFRNLVLLPLSHKKMNTVWLPYELIIDMTKAVLLTERRNFRTDFSRSIEENHGLVIDKRALQQLPLIDTWEGYQGQMVHKDYPLDKCFPIKLDPNIACSKINKVYLKSIGMFQEWEFTGNDLLRFYADPRFQGFLYNAGFCPPNDQLELSLLA